jgi:hypothetical protein
MNKSKSISCSERNNPISLRELEADGYIEDKNLRKGFATGEQSAIGVCIILFLVAIACGAFEIIHITFCVLLGFISLGLSWVLYRRMRNIVPLSKYSGKPVEIYANSDAEYGNYKYEDGVLELLYVCHESKKFFRWLAETPGSD